MTEGFVLKAVPEDFRVREKTLFETGSGRFAYYLLWKRDLTTHKAIQMVGRALRKRTKFINFAGNKDRRAVTEQVISILHGPSGDLNLGQLRLEFLGRGSKRINLGNLEGNEFHITVRRILDRPKPIKVFPNYFDTQRFGLEMKNHLIGRSLVKQDFSGAVKMIPEIREHLTEKPKDFLGALRKLPKGIYRLFIHSYQSYIWNLSASCYISRFKHGFLDFPLGRLALPLEETENLEIPVVGYQTRIKRDKTGRIVSEILKGEGIQPEDFRIKALPELDNPGRARPLLCPIENLRTGKLEEDDLNPGFRKVKVSFSLPQGSYATMALKCLFSPKS